MNAAFDREIRRSVECCKVDLFLNFRRDLASLFAVEWQAKLEENILQSHHTEADIAPAVVGLRSAGDSVVIQINDLIQLTNRKADVAADLVVIDLAVLYITSHVDRTEVADGGFVVTRNLDDFRTEI